MSSALLRHGDVETPRSYYTSGLGREPGFEESGDVTRHRAGEIGLAPHQMDIGQFRRFLQGEVVNNPGAQGCAGHIDAQHLDHRHDRSVMETVPTRFVPVVGGRQTRLLLQLARDVACYVDSAVPDVVEIRHAGWKIDPAGICGLLRHLAERKSTVT